MTWLAPLGFLGLIGLIILIIIYIIKPNYQLRYISSTYVWKLSLKYKKKKLPLSKLRNILLFLCQVAIIIGTTCILAQPFINQDNSKSEGDSIIIVDASASMQAEVSSQSRFERAVEAAMAEANEALENGRKVTVILASDKASFLVQQATKDQAQLVYDAFDKLTLEAESLWTYGTPDVEGAMNLAEQITSYAKNATVSMYTDTTYLNAGAVTVHNVADTAEWNAAILDVRATVVENYYRFEIDIASYGADNRLDVMCEIFNANDLDVPMEIELEAYCSDDQVTTLVLGYVAEDMPEEEKELITENVAIFSYDHIYVHLNAYDSLDCDNRFYLYGGKKPTIKVQYSSSLPNNYWASALLVLQDTLRDRWDVEITEVEEGQEPAMEGFDVYIFEHAVPKTIPMDGIVIYSNPDLLPADAGVRFGQVMGANGELFLSPGEDHPIMKNIDASKISVTRFTSINGYDSYIPLVMYEENPLILLKDDVDQKILLLPFSMHYSNLALLPNFPLLLNNVINYFFPVTIEEYKYEINDVVSMNARANELKVEGPNVELTFDKFPAELTVTEPGTFTMTQIPISGVMVIEHIHVNIPASESDINLEESVLKNPYFYEESDTADIDLLFYFALAVVALLFIEWWLKSRDQI